MAKSMQLNISGAMRKVKSIYINIGGTLRKVKKGFVNIGGVLREFLSGEPSYYGTAPALSAYADFGLTLSGSFGSGAMFFIEEGGEVYNTSLVKSVKTQLLRSGDSMGVAAMAGSGQVVCIPFNSYYPASFNSSFVATELSRQNDRLSGHAGTSLGEYAIFGGGDTTSGYVRKYVFAYDASLTRTSLTGSSSALDKASVLLSATNNGTYAIFAGGASSIGSSGTSRDTVTAYNTSLVRTIPAELSKGRERLGAARVGNYALFVAGSMGNISPYKTDEVDSYNQSLVHGTPTSFSALSGRTTGTSVGGYGVFVGEGVTNAYNESLVRFVLQSTSFDSSGGYYSATVGNYALFTALNNQSVEGLVEVYSV